jgi:transketolase
MPHDAMANAIRALSMDAVQQANSGHPGMPMGMADIAQVLWHDFLKHAPTQPHWPDRDRFIISNGHGSMLLYSLLHLSGYTVSLDDIKNFRQLHSITPGHPEYAETPGVETTTGPLGNGFTNAVGMAIAERKLAAEFNRPDFKLLNHFTYVFLGDGCLMEGISHEAASFAGTQKLGKLIAFWDDNGISIDGDVTGWFTDNTAERFKAYGWHVVADIDGHDKAAIRAAIKQAQAETEKPTLLCCKTTIGFGSPNLAGSEKTHGAPLGDEEIKASKAQLNWPYAPFEIPKDVYEAWDAKAVGEERYQGWQQLLQAYTERHPELASEFKRRTAGKLPEGFAQVLEQWVNGIQQEKVATRKSSQQCIEFLSSKLPELVGGSADLSGSNGTKCSTARILKADNPAGNYLEYGVREFAMSAMMNGMALYKGIIPFGGTFLVFSDYARNAVRLAALMQQRVIFVYTHDSIGVGEDGPTHQPIEHLASLRLIPNLHVWRPCDTVETAVAWAQTLLREDGPAVLALTRQDLQPQTHQDAYQKIAKGGYVLSDSDGQPEVIILATGSEVEIAVAAQLALKEENIAARVVSMPCFEVFKAQAKSYQDEVLPPNITKRVAIEAGVPETWLPFVKDLSNVIGISRFGLSAPAAQIYQEFGLTVDNIVAKCKLL